MTTGKININISGGNSNIGNISQGDNNSNIVQSQAFKLEAEQAFSDFFNSLEKLYISKQVHEDKIVELRNEVLSIKESLQRKSTSKESLVQIAKSLYEKYGWAADILKKLFLIIVPG
jgi:hypothetical protein